jgi:hypothetical protein
VIVPVSVKKSEVIATVKTNADLTYLQRKSKLIIWLHEDLILYSYTLVKGTVARYFRSSVFHPSTPPRA